MHDRPSDFGAAAAADAAAATGPAGALQERLLGRGVFRRFLDAHVGRGAEHYEASASAGFLAAAGGILRYIFYTSGRFLLVPSITRPATSAGFLAAAGGILRCLL